MKNHLLHVSLSLLVLICAILFLHTTQKPYSGKIVDVSWPNCSVKTTHDYQTGIIGVNGGLDFRSNPCLNNEATWFKNYSLYINTGYPGASFGIRFQNSPRICSRANYQCLAYNWGYNATLYALNYAARSDVHSFFWWLDVETDNSWTGSSLINRASLLGAEAAIKSTTALTRVGYYSSSDQWATITNQWHNHLPTWLATGDSTRNNAARDCSISSFTGGQTWLAQYTSGLDINTPCINQIEKVMMPPKAAAY